MEDQKIDLNSKWDTLAKGKKGDALLISDKCIPELFLSTDANLNRRLLLFLPKGLGVTIKETEKNRLSISFLPTKKVLQITLKDPDFTDLFNDLISSIYTKINSISDHSSASKEFVEIFYKWFDFFKDSINKKLDKNKIQGLFGELFVLNEFIKSSTPSTINKILYSWRGLYDTANDFEFTFKNIEVKTKKESSLFVKISSEFQLEKPSNKSLELLVVSVKIDLIKGKSIHDMLLEIVKQIRVNLGDLSILYQALNQKGLTIDNLKQYNNYRFSVIKTESFDAGNDNFPKLTCSNIVNEISKLKYNLKVTQLDLFLIELKKY